MAKRKADPKCACCTPHGDAIFLVATIEDALKIVRRATKIFVTVPLSPANRFPERDLYQVTRQQAVNRLEWRTAKKLSMVNGRPDPSVRINIMLSSDRSIVLGRS